MSEPPFEDFAIPRRVPTGDVARKAPLTDARRRSLAASITRICGALNDDGYTHLYECELPPGHAGDHQSTHRWPNEPEEKP